MEHNHAVESHAIERYLLSEMSPAERDAFEEHYFSCAECAEGVRSAAGFRDSARVLLGDVRRDTPVVPEPAPPRRWWSLPQLIPLAAAVAFAGVVIYLEAFEIPTLKRHSVPAIAAQPMVSVALHGITRGDPSRIPTGGDFFSVYFDLPPEAHAASYDYTVTDSRNSVAAALAAPAPRSGAPVNLLFPRSNFPSGRYTITIREGSAVVSQLNFVVE